MAFIQFFKKRNSGEVKLLRRFSPRFRVLNFRQGHPDFEKFTPAQEKKFHLKINKYLETTARLVESGFYDLVVLDEALIGLRDGCFTEKKILELVNRKPGSVELVLTGRGATGKVTAAADLVTRMEPVKHPFFKGEKARRGIEY